MKQTKRRPGRPANPIDFTNRGSQMLCAKAGENRSRFADEVGLSPEMLNHLIHGRRRPSLTLAMELETRLKIPAKAWFAKPRLAAAKA